MQYGNVSHVVMVARHIRVEDDAGNLLRGADQSGPPAKTTQAMRIGNRRMQRRFMGGS